MSPQAHGLIPGVVAPGQYKAGPFLRQNRAFYEASLGPIHPASLNVRIKRVIPTWCPWQLGPRLIAGPLRWVACTVWAAGNAEGAAGNVLQVEYPAPSYNECKPQGFTYPDLTLLEIVCAEETQGVGYGSDVKLEVDLSALY